MGDVSAENAAAAQGSSTDKPQLLFFFGKTSGPSRRVEAFLSQVLQRRQNHDTFHLVRVCAEDHAKVLERFLVEEVPTILVVEGRRVRARVVAPRGRRELEDALRPWLR
jgi:thioredoxin-like negative regulator of GroEL